jgi:hypothetical protein
MLFLNVPLSGTPARGYNNTVGQTTDQPGKIIKLFENPLSTEAARALGLLLGDSDDVDLKVVEL